MIGFVRFWYVQYWSDLFSLILVKKDRYLTEHKYLTDYQYDILMVYSDNRDIILENIDHQDIVFFRRTNKQSKDQPLGWVINCVPDALEKRFEVKFFDRYDLLNEGNSALYVIYS
jgi:hypothetical protein